MHRLVSVACCTEQRFKRLGGADNRRTAPSHSYRAVAFIPRHRIHTAPSHSYRAVAFIPRRRIHTAPSHSYHASNGTRNRHSSWRSYCGVADNHCWACGPQAQVERFGPCCAVVDMDFAWPAAPNPSRAGGTKPFQGRRHQTLPGPAAPSPLRAGGTKPFQGRRHYTLPGPAAPNPSTVVTAAESNAALFGDV
eukprot:364771-Chlamydomonas_euryale.AAC.6